MCASFIEGLSNKNRNSFFLISNQTDMDVCSFNLFQMSGLQLSFHLFFGLPLFLESYAGPTQGDDRQTFSVQFRLHTLTHSTINCIQLRSLSFSLQILSRNVFPCMVLTIFILVFRSNNCIVLVIHISVQDIRSILQNTHSYFICFFLQTQHKSQIFIFS